MGAGVRILHTFWNFLNGIHLTYRSLSPGMAKTEIGPCKPPKNGIFSNFDPISPKIDLKTGLNRSQEDFFWFTGLC